ILTPIYEAEFLGFSYGFRPGRNQHDALDALAYGINARKINWVLDADIARYFDTLSREWLIRFIEHRVGDRRIIRLIPKWLKAGVMEDGQVVETTEGTPQGSVASPLLANVYLHYAYDLWAEQWRSRHAKGDMIIVRYADDQIVGFQHRSDAERILSDLKERLAVFALSLHPEKTRLSSAAENHPPHRVRQIRCRAPSGAWSGQAGNVRLPRADTLLRHRERRHRVPTRTQDTAKANAR